MAVKFANNVSTTLTSAINATQTTISVADASGLPSLSSGDYIYLTIDTDTASPTLEVVKVTAVSSNDLTVVRGQDGTTASSFSAGVKVELRVTAAALGDISSQAQTAADTESVSKDGDTMTGQLNIHYGSPTLRLKDTTDDDDHHIQFTSSTDAIVYSIDSQNATSGDAFTFYSASQEIVQRIGSANILEAHASEVISNVKLRIKGTSPDLVLEDTDVGNTNRSEIRNVGGLLRIQALGENSIQFKTNGTSRLTVGSTGTFNFQGNNLNSIDDLFITGAYYSDGVNIITTNRAIQNITSISSGAITSTGNIITNNSSRIENGRISMEADGTLDWGASKNVGTLTWDTGKAIIRGQSGSAIEFQTNGSSVAATFDTSQNATFNGIINTKTYTPSNNTDWTNVVNINSLYIASHVNSGQQFTRFYNGAWTGYFYFNSGSSSGEKQNVRIQSSGNNQSTNKIEINDGTAWRRVLIETDKNSMALTGTPTAPTAAAGTDTTQIATTAFVTTAIDNIVDAAPGSLDTLNELAAALGDDANFSTTVTNSIATKLAKAGGTMTGTIDSHVGDTGVILKSGNTSATGTPDQFKISHNLGGVDISNSRGSINFTTGLGAISVTGNSEITGSGSSGRALDVHRGSDNASALYVLNTGEVLIPSNYLYVNASQGAYFTGAIRARGGITNDGNNNLSISSGGSAITFNSKNFTSVGTISSGAITSTGTSSFNNFRLTDASKMGFGTVRAGATVGHNSTTEEGIFWHTGDDYGIYRTSGNWSSPNYQQLKIRWVTGIELDGGTSYGKSGVNLINNTDLYANGNLILDSSTRKLHNITEIKNSSDITIKPAAGSDALFFNAHNSESQLRLYNNRQDAGNVPVSSIVGYNSTQVAKMVFYRGNGGSSGYIRFQNKPTNEASLTDVFQIGNGNTVGYGVDIRAGGLRVGGTEVITSSRQITNVSEIKNRPNGNGDTMWLVGGDVGIVLDGPNNIIRPTEETSGGVNNKIELGSNTYRFKTLHLGTALNMAGQTIVDSNRVLQNVTLSAGLLNTGTLPDARLSSSVVKFGSYSQLHSSGDLNNLSGFRLYRVTGGTNRATTAHHNVLQISNSDANKYNAQLAFTTDSSNNQFYFRAASNGTYSSWERLFADNYHPNADKWTNARTLTLSGAVTGSASFDGSANFTLSTALPTPPQAPANWKEVILWDGGLKKDSAVKIHGDGYLTATYLNMTHGVGTRSSDTVFYSSNDDFIRKNNATGMRTALSVYSKSESDSRYWQKQGSWYGDLGSNGYDRVQGVTYTGGEFVLVEKNAQISTLVDGDYFAYEAGGFYSSNNSTYGNLSGFKATGANAVTFTQKDGGVVDVVGTRDFLVPSGGYFKATGNAQSGLMDTLGTNWVIPRDTWGNFHIKVGNGNWYSDANTYHIRNSGAAMMVQINSSGVDAKQGGFRINGTNVVDSDRAIRFGGDSVQLRSGTISVGGDAATYYPVTWYGSSGSNQAYFRRIKIYRNYSETAPSSWYTASHKGGLVLDLEVNFGGWGGVNYDIKVNEFSELYSTMVAKIGHFANMRGFAIWLRGGTATYHYVVEGGPAPTVQLSAYDPGGNGTGVSSTTTLDQATITNRRYFNNGDLFDNGSRVLTQGTSFGGDVSGTYNNLSVNGGNSNTVGGVGESSFMRKSANSHLDMNDWNIEDVWNIQTNGSNADVKFSVWTGTTYGIGMHSGVTLGHLNDYAMTFCMNNDSDRGFWWGYSGQAKSAGAMSLTTSGKLWVTTDVTTPSVYLNSTNTRLTQGDGNGLRVTTNFGWINIGPQNTSHCHITTDRSNFWFSKEVVVDGGIIGSYNEDLYLRRARVAADQIQLSDGYTTTSNPIRYPAGSATAPSVTATADTNTGIFFPGSDVLKFTTGGTTRLTLNNSTTTIAHDDVRIGQYLYHNGDTNTYIRYTTDRIRMVAGGVTFMDMVEGATDYLRFNTRGVTIGSNTAPQATLTIDQSCTETPANGCGTGRDAHLKLENTNTTGSASTCIIFNAKDSGGNMRHGAGIQFKKAIAWSANGQYPGELYFWTRPTSGNQAAAQKLDKDGNAIFKGNVTAYGSLSDRRLKENIEPITDAVAKVEKLEGVTFDYKKDGRRSTGLIAQDLEEVLPEAVYTTTEVEGTEEHKAIHYGNTVGLLVNAIKEQQQMINQLTKRIEELENGNH